MNYDKYKPTTKIETVSFEEKKRVKKIQKKLEIKHELKEVIVKGLEAELEELNAEIERKNQTQRDWYKEDKDLYEQFKQDLFEELDITDNPKREKLFEKAWELGHSSGYSQVYYYAEDLCDLIE